jgi:hypothetical protein
MLAQGRPGDLPVASCQDHQVLPFPQPEEQTAYDLVRPLPAFFGRMFQRMGGMQMAEQPEGDAPFGKVSGDPGNSPWDGILWVYIPWGFIPTLGGSFRFH